MIKTEKYVWVLFIYLFVSTCIQVHICIYTMVLFSFFLEKHKLKAAKRVHKSNGGNKGIMLYLKKILTTISKAPELKY